MFGDNFTPVFGREEMRTLDRVSIERGTPSIELMERAGRAVTDCILAYEPLRARKPSGIPFRVLIAAGPGNNGGDGYVIARLLEQSGARAVVAQVLAQPHEDSDCAKVAARWREQGGEVLAPANAAEAIRSARSEGFHAIVDAVFGTGLDRSVEGEAAQILRVIAEARLPVAAVDIPSGLCADTGVVLGVCVPAVLCVAIGGAKPGLFLDQAPDFTGRVRVVDIGLLNAEEAGVRDVGQVIDGTTCAAWLKPRSGTTHKGSLGRVLIIGGSLGRIGAPLLAARGALRAGAGLVTIGVPATLALQTDTAMHETMTFALPDNGQGALAEKAWQVLAEPLRAFDCIAVGPGLGTGIGVRDFVIELVRNFPGRLIVDADALNELAASRLDLAVMFTKRRRVGHGAAIFTPHPGEAGRMLAIDSAAVQDDRLGVVEDLTHGSPSTIVLKGAATIIGSGKRIGFNTSGNPGLASAGMGDVLAGVCAAITMHEDDPFRAAALAVHAHGLAGDILAAELGGPGFLASEVADTIPRALAALLGDRYASVP